jgi:hypothetical protein
MHVAVFGHAETYLHVTGRMTWNPGSSSKMEKPTKPTTEPGAESERDSCGP